MGWEHGDSHWLLQTLLLAEKGELGFVLFSCSFSCVFFFPPFKKYLCLSMLHIPFIRLMPRRKLLVGNREWGAMFEGEAAVAKQLFHFRCLSLSCCYCFISWRQTFWCNFPQPKSWTASPVVVVVLWRHASTRTALSDWKYYQLIVVVKAVSNAPGVKQRET